MISGGGEQNPQLSLCKADTLDRGRARMANEIVMKQYFTVLEEMADRLEIKNDPKEHIICNSCSGGNDIEIKKFQLNCNGLSLQEEENVNINYREQ